MEGADTTLQFSVSPFQVASHQMDQTWQIGAPTFEQAHSSRTSILVTIATVLMYQLCQHQGCQRQKLSEISWLSHSHHLAVCAISIECSQWTLTCDMKVFTLSFSIVPYTCVFLTLSRFQFFKLSPSMALTNKLKNSKCS